MKLFQKMILTVSVLALANPGQISAGVSDSMMSFASKNKTKIGLVVAGVAVALVGWWYLKPKKKTAAPAGDASNSQENNSSIQNPVDQVQEQPEQPIIQSPRPSLVVSPAQEPAQPVVVPSKTWKKLDEFIAKKKASERVVDADRSLSHAHRLAHKKAPVSV